jgi:hypothetical protein
MLRITSTPSPTGTCLRLEGKLLKPWVNELKSCLGTHSEHSPLSLDLSALSFADVAGLTILRDALARGIRLNGCSGFLHLLLRRDDSCLR